MDTFLIPILILGALIVFYLIIFQILGLRIISSNEVAVVEKWWSPKGSLKDSIIALNGEAGYEPTLLRGGIHFKSVFMYKIHKYPLITIPQGQIAYIFARDGKPLAPTQTLGRVILEADNFQDVKGFLQSGGQKGPQRGILREGTYAINLAQFIVITPNDIKAINITKQDRNELNAMQQTLVGREAFSPVIIMGNKKEVSDQMCIVTVHDGPPLENGEIIADDVGAEHSNFQDPEKFLELGGKRGKQLRVLTDGTYYINRLFATVEYRPKTVVPIGFVGVVVSFYGKEGVDTTGADYKHGELVGNGCKGVLEKPLMPGKYAFNTDAGKVVLVPTTNIILKWNKSETGNHKYDENLTEVDIITKDAFEPSLPLSVVMHIDYKQAPWVIQRFGDISMLVNQSLDPLVSAYFKDVAQTKTLIELIQERSEIRERAVNEMEEKFQRYNLRLEEVLIGTPKTSAGDIMIENILTQLRERQIAEEKKVTYQKQQEAAESEKTLREAQAAAEQQEFLTKSKIQIEVERNNGAALASKAEQEANQITALAKANSTKIRLEGEAEASKETNIGLAKAQAIDAQVKAYGGAEFRVVQEVVDKLSDAIKNAQVDIVPKTVVNMGGNNEHGENSNTSSSVMDTLLKFITLDKLGVSLDEQPQEKERAESTKDNVISNENALDSTEIESIEDADKKETEI
ncbi:SPFH domain-containing protein [Anaerosacchariphilus polymeriproducens]|uniref:Flotillin family protein n=1 Tax=Anaerosacchariphilus polymeriproducens TaxID=1812858 RepID=A0A371ASU5_9FIRM|nr:SPFH domain-containing protein [Anaerosacchariphilus polymeriproducens]RDU22643.1 flotillin family protein [Anaerosacchariphilus polymeriproducens]